MKKNKLSNTLFIICAVILIGVSGIAIRDYFNLRIKNYPLHTQIFVSVCAAVIFVCAMILIIIVAVRTWSSRLKKIAFFNTNYLMFNEIGFCKIQSKRARKWNEAYLVCFYPSQLKDQLTSQLGYEKVDLILQGVSDITKNLFNKPSFTFGYNSNEFFMVLIKGDMEVVKSTIEEFNKEFETTLKEKVIFSKVPLAYGVYKYDQKEKIEDQITKANIARLNASKNVNKSVTTIYNEALINESLNEVQLRKEIDDAILNEEFEVYYQPKFDLRLNRFGACEALIKWNHPTKGLIHAGGFIPYAEKSNQIVAIDRYIFRHVLADIVSWKKRGVRLLPVSINLSRNDAYQPDLITFIRDTVKEYGVSPQLIELELTESAISKDMLHINQILRQIRDLGIKTDMDDFGTGYSSLSMLYKLPLDVIKIDKSFFDNIEVDQKARDIVKSMITLGKTCGMTIVAEGIETEKQYEFVKKTKCDYIQGYYFSTSLSKVDYENFLLHNKFERKVKN